MRRTVIHQGYDLPLLFAVLGLVGIGLVMVYSASSALAVKTHGSETYFLRRQAMFVVLGLAVLVVVRHVPFTWYRPLVYPLLVLAVALLAAVHLPGLGQSAGGAQRWLRLGVLTFQPSEPARVALVIYLAYSLSKKGPRLARFSIGFLPHAGVAAVLAGLVLAQPDFGSALILMVITGVMMFLGGVRLRHLTLALAALIPAAAILVLQAEYRLRRLISFWDPWSYATDEGYQIIHSLMAFGTGGLWGVGLGGGYQKLFYLPEPHTDFIFAVIGEELGLAGVLTIIGLYGVIVWRGLRIALRCPDDFGILLALGLSLVIALGAVINMAVCLALLPTKGLTLPFLSYGGTSLLMHLTCAGILLNVGARHG